MEQTDPSNAIAPLEKRPGELPQSALRTASTAPQEVSDLSHFDRRPDQPFGEYRLIRRLGAGGMGTVFEAEHIESNRRLALKVLGRSLNSPDARARFLREGRLAALVSHPNLVYVYGTEEINDVPIITMELMTGGTLEELLCREGPMPVTKAVDAILQIIEGLESVWTAGVLHRDIKPSNCFIAPDGIVKVGDFGLSVSSLPTEDSNLTREDCYMGTPAYCSPEQIRGDPLDVRSDIYSVGATFYFLLTGHAPFVGTSVVRLLSKVLERPPESPSKLRPEISRELSKVVMRCLEKQPTSRYGSYMELRNALLPFSSTSVGSATLGLRLLAFAIDSIAYGAVGLAIALLAMRSDWAFLKRMGARPSNMLSFSVFEMLWTWAYFCLSEYFLRATPGKSLCHLRVISTRTRFTFVQALVRSGLFVVLPDIPAWALVALVPATAVHSGMHDFLMGLPHLLCLLLLFSTMRRSNRFAGLHELLSSTRVIRTARYQTRPRAAVAASMPEVDPDAPKIGPYLTLGRLDSTPSDEMYLGYDSRLRRTVWIRPAQPQQAPVEGNLRRICRPGRLHWLSSRRLPDENWDAYEAASGSALLTLIAKPQPWAAVRYWLTDLAEELSAASKDGTFPKNLSLDRVWIDGENRAKVLDFPAPLPPTIERSAPQPVQPDNQLTEFQRIRSFLREVASSALEGRVVKSSQPDHSIRIPLPLSARQLLKDLPESPAPEPLVADLRAALQKPPAVSSRARLALVAGCLLFPVVMTIAVLCVQYVVEQWHSMYPDLGPLQVLLKRLDTMEQSDVPLGPNRKAEKDAIEVYVASRFRTMILDPTVWDSPSIQTVLTPDEQRLAEESLGKHPHVSSEEMNRAMAQIKPLIDELNRWHAPSPTLMLEAAAVLGGTAIVFIMLPAMAAAMLFRGGMLLHSMDLAIVDRKGSRASRLRIFARSFVTWSPLLLLELLLVERSALTFWVGLPLAALLVAGVIVPLFTPSRGLQERLTGTYLVPQ